MIILYTILTAIIVLTLGSVIVCRPIIMQVISLVEKEPIKELPVKELPINIKINERYCSIFNINFNVKNHNLVLAGDPIYAVIKSSTGVLFRVIREHRGECWAVKDQTFMLTWEQIQKFELQLYK